MFVQDFKNFINVDCESESTDNNPVVLELKNKTLWLTYTWVGGILTKKRMPWDEEGAWVFPTTIQRLKVIKNDRNAAIITITIEDDETMLIKTLSRMEKGDREIKHQILSWKSAKTEIDLDNFEADSQTLTLTMDAWTAIRQAGQIIISDAIKKDVLSSYVRLDIFKKTGFATGYSPGMISYIQFSCEEELTQSRVYLIPITLIGMVTTLKLESPLISLRLSADRKQLLTTIDDKYFLTEVPSDDKYPILDGVLREEGKNSLVTLEDKTSLQAALQLAKDAGVKNVTLSFESGEITVDAGKKLAKVSIPVDSVHRFTSTLKLSVNLMLDALKAINVTKILLLFPAATGKALIIETFTGVIYLILAITKVTTHIIELAKEIVDTTPDDKPKPRRKEVSTGKTSDGQPFVVEAVEENPLLPIKGETPEERLMDVQSQCQEVLEVLKNEREIARSNGKKILEKVDTTLKDAKVALSESEANILLSEEAKLKEMQSLLEGVIKESEQLGGNTRIVADEYLFEELEAISLKLYFVGGRVLSFLLHKEPTWKLEIRIINPVSNK